MAATSNSLYFGESIMRGKIKRLFKCGKTIDVLPGQIRYSSNYISGKFPAIIVLE